MLIEKIAKILREEEYCDYIIIDVTPTCRKIRFENLNYIFEITENENRELYPDRFELEFSIPYLKLDKRKCGKGVKIITLDDFKDDPKDYFLYPIYYCSRNTEFTKKEIDILNIKEFTYDILREFKYALGDALI